MPDDRRRTSPSNADPAHGRRVGRAPAPLDPELRETLELLATVAASVSDRVEGQSAALDRMAKVLAETRTAAFAARKQTDPRLHADQVASLVEDRLGRTLAVLHQNASRLGQEADRARRLTDQT